MQLDFWQHSHGSIERIVAQIASRVCSAGGRLLVVDADAQRRVATGRALWDVDGAFLANGEASGPHAARHPVLLSDACEPANAARTVVLADGVWRPEAEAFDRAILLFGETGVEPARAVWRAFDGRADVARGYFAQEAGKWVKKA